MVHSIASTTRSNQHRESFPYELRKIQPNCYSNMEMVMRVLMVMMVVMIYAETAKSFCGRSPSLRVSGGWYTPEERGWSGPGRPHHSQAWPRPARAMGWCGPPVAHHRPLLASFLFWKNRIFHIFSWIFWYSWILPPNSTFSIRILNAAVHAPKVINHAKIDEIT